MKSMIRINALKLSGYGDKSLSKMEKHGKRLDGTSKKRRVRVAEPLVYNTLDLMAAYEEHVSGCRMNKSLRAPALQAIIKFPTEITPTIANQKKMLKLAVKFVNEVYGGDAVFAARLDRDEEGEHIVDIFFSPKYVKRTKDRRGNPIDTQWISTTKHGSDLCKKHKKEICNRNEEGKFTSTPRSVGIALQSELRLFFSRHGIKIDKKKTKDGYRPDRLDTEAYKNKLKVLKARDLIKLREKKLDATIEETARLLDEAKKEKAAAEMLKRDAKITLDAAEKVKADQEMIIKKAVEKEAKTAADNAAKAVMDVMDGKVRRSETGALQVEDPEKLRPIWPVIGPTINRLLVWWEKFKPQVEALDPKERPDLYDDEPAL